MPASSSPAAAAYPQALFDLMAKRYPPLKIAAAMQVGRELGMAEADLLANTGLSLAEVLNADTPTSVEQLLSLVRNLLRARPALDIGLQIGQRIHMSSYGLYGYALLCAESLRHACDIVVRYNLLGAPIFQTLFEERPHEAVWQFVPFEKTSPEALDGPLYRCLLEAQFMQHIVGSKDVMGADCTPMLVRMCLPCPEPAHAEQLAAAYGCPIEFEQTHNELCYRPSWLDQPPRLANALVAGQMARNLADQMQAFQRQTGVARQVMQEITRRPGYFPDMEETAASLNMSSRHLRRKLEEENTAYQTLLSQVKYALAQDYLRGSALTSEDIAAALAFSDATSFRNAFKRWSGTTPAEFRARQKT